MTALAADELDRLASQRWMNRLSRRSARNAEIRIGGLRINPNLSALGRVGGRLGYQVGLEALRAKLASFGLAGPVLDAVEQELKREGLTLGPLAKPSPLIGSLGALTPQALAGRWLAQKI